MPLDDLPTTMRCPGCKGLLMRNPSGQFYCPVCDPDDAGKLGRRLTVPDTPCPACDGSGERRIAGLRVRLRPALTCRYCAGSGLDPNATVPPRLAEHWGFRAGLFAHAQGARRDDSLFSGRDDADRAWRLGWAIAERAAVVQSIRERIEAEQIGRGDWIDRCGGPA